MSRQQSILPGSLWCQSPVDDNFDLEDIYHARLVESSTQTVTLLGLQVQFLVSRLPLFRRTLANWLHFFFPPCYQLVEGAFILRLNHILLSCRLIALSLIRNRCSRLCSRDRLSIPIGGGRQYLFLNSSIMTSIVQGGDHLTSDHVFRFVDHVDDTGCLAYPLDQDFVYADLTLTDIVPFLSKQMVQKIARIHNIPFSSRWNLAEDELVKLFDGHNCINCTLYTSVLESRLSPSLKKKEHSEKAFASLTKKERAEQNKKKRDKKSQGSKRAVEHNMGPPTFPPSPLTNELGETII